jgi:hypothetical protein
MKAQALMAAHRCYNWVSPYGDMRDLRPHAERFVNSANAEVTAGNELTPALITELVRRSFPAKEVVDGTITQSTIVKIARVLYHTSVSPSAATIYTNPAS